MSKSKQQLPSKKDNPAEWYTQVIRLADLADYGPAKGTMIFKPYGYSIWEKVQEEMNVMIKEHGVGNAYFPLFIPMELLEKEANHVDGFAPELAVVTHGGGEKLENPLAVRPTSETIMYDSYAKWIQSYRDLPMMMNQWNNVVRWEKRTSLFMRTSEFLWQEGHTAHATHEDARATQEWAMDMYKKVYFDLFAIYGYVGNKSTAERFAGADSTLTFEALMPSGKALQSCTSHDLGQNFSKPFGINFQDENGDEAHVWQTSWGLSTRSIGGLVMAHGDENGLKLPPRIAPIQAVIVPVRTDDTEVMDYGAKVASQLKELGVRVEFDTRDDERMGWKINKWEVRGVPLRIEIGGNEASGQKLTIARRDTGEKSEIALSDAKSILKLLDTIQADMFETSKTYTEENTREAKDYDELKQIVEEHSGFVKVAWNDDPEIEDKIQTETKATSRCSAGAADATDFFTGKPADTYWYFAKSY